MKYFIAIFIWCLIITTVINANSHTHTEIDNRSVSAYWSVSDGCFARYFAINAYERIESNSTHTKHSYYTYISQNYYDSCSSGSSSSIIQLDTKVDELSISPDAAHAKLRAKNLIDNNGTRIDVKLEWAPTSSASKCKCESSYKINSTSYHESTKTRHKKSILSGYIRYDGSTFHVSEADAFVTRDFKRTF